MFQCKKCLEAEGFDTEYMHFSSVGPCETCHVTTSCVDLPSWVTPDTIVLDVEDEK